MPSYLNALGLLCALGEGKQAVADALLAGDASGMRAVRGLPNVHWVDMFPLSSNADGSWLRFSEAPAGAKGKRIWYRQPDRIHLTKDGGKLVGTRVMQTLSTLSLRKVRL